MTSPLCLLAAALALLATTTANQLRKNVDQLSSGDILELQKHLREVAQDDSAKGYRNIAAMHGYPAMCKDGERPVACCVHGDPSFPHWHRLYVVQLEQALKEKGQQIGIPYWDWTKPMSSLPDLVSQQIFIDRSAGKAFYNSWYRGEIMVNDRKVYTARAVDDRLFQKVEAGQHTDLFELVLNALEYDNFCQFEVQFEIAHNSIHYLVGGRHTFSMSTLEYTAYDPIFFLHHSNVDRIYFIYEKLVEMRGNTVVKGKCTGRCEYCDVRGYNRRLEPFSWDKNPFTLTNQNAAPSTATQHKNYLDYSYDDLALDGHDLDELAQLVKARTSSDRAFAKFRLGAIGGSANVRVQVCVQGHCEFAGDFFILGGSIEMKWAFRYPYFFEITKTVQSLGVELDGHYEVQAQVYSVNGTELPSDIIPAPSVEFRPAQGKKDEPIAHLDEAHVHELHEDAVRKDINRLSKEEMYELREAMQKFQLDKSVDGYQATAEFHGDPGRCPYPSAAVRQACCVHGMPTFPHWHRLFVVQVENALKKRGSGLGIPYWDWTKSGLPELAAEDVYSDPKTGDQVHNPFYNADVAFKNNVTSRDIREDLNDPSVQAELYNAYLLALEQDNFCDFEIQFEIAHNLIHALVGGRAKYGLSSLSYSAYDPIFYLHHSNVDRIWAIWTSLQHLRGKSYKAHCAQSYVQTPLKPFSFDSPLNNDEVTHAHSVAENIYDYEHELHYVYDSLEFGGMTPEALHEHIEDSPELKDRFFAGIMLHGIKRSAMGKLYIIFDGQKNEAGRFAILGGPSEMPWRFDREFRLDITEALKTSGVKDPDKYTYDLVLELEDFEGNPLDASDFPAPIVIHKFKEDTDDQNAASFTKVRKDVSVLSDKEMQSIRHVMEKLQTEDDGWEFQQLGRWHGSPEFCPSPDAEVKFACCLHGMALFPHWHRLWTVQAEEDMRELGLKFGLPYWDWTKPISSLPALVINATYKDGDQVKDNPFFSGPVKSAGVSTARDPQDDLFEAPAFGDFTYMAKQVLLALEQEDYCDFEVQFEIAHNFLHALVGGTQQYSMANLAYTAFDPIFYLHHSNTDRIWALWQALQHYRGKPADTANCAIGQFKKPLAPFNFSDQVRPNEDDLTYKFSNPYQAFDYRKHYNYEYDNLEFNGLSIPQLVRVLEEIKAEDRVFAGFMLHGIKESALVKFSICQSADDCHDKVNKFYVLGSEYEMPWVYDRLYKFDITQQLADYGLKYNDRYSIKYTVQTLAGKDLGQPFSQPSVVFKLGKNNLYGQEFQEVVTTASHIRKDLSTLSEGETESLRAAFLAIQNDKTYEEIAAFHGKPGLCEYQGRKVACCVHGMATFPAWHRLYIEQVEEALLAYGSAVAVPYWDWTKPIDKLPALINQATYFNSRSQTFEPNPFFSGSIKGEDARTTRDPQAELFDNDYLYEATLLALEQDNFCDFEIQFEIVHNALHALLGGRARYSMSSLDYTAYDPVFFLHHSNTDRIWAIWQELQRFRGLPYNEADCAINLMRTPLQPFGDNSRNHGDPTFRYSRPADTFDYRNHFGYDYDNLKFNGMTTSQLEALLTQRKEQGRVFAGFLLHNIGLSANVHVHICVPSGPKGAKNCDTKAGSFAVLGGELEMPFVFDRLYKHDITKAVRELGLKLDSAASFELQLDIMAVNGSHLSSDILPSPTVLFQPGTKEAQESDGSESSYLVRKNMDMLTLQEKESLVKALAAVQADSSPDGYQAIASFHALPPLCPSPTATDRYACCLHGMATFPHWHRLYTVQLEDALRRHGALVGIPYWDWTRRISELPALLKDEKFHLTSGQDTANPWHKADIEFEGTQTERNVNSKLFEAGPHDFDTWLFRQSLLALEQEDFCDFEIQLEITHNAVHSWLGGDKNYSMSHLHYSSYDPVFYIHHSNTDRLWALWQALQEYRGKSPNVVNCALEQMREPLKPFSFGAPYNLNSRTKQYSKPEDTFDYQGHFGYRYDDLEFVGMSLPRLDSYIREAQSKDRVFAGFLLKGFYKSATVSFSLVDKGGTVHPAGMFTVLGGSAEMPWQFDRLYKYEITDLFNDAGLHYDDEYKFEVIVKDNQGNVLKDHPIPTPSVFFESGKGEADATIVTPNKVRRNVNDLSQRDLQSIKAALKDFQQDTGTDGWANLVSFHGYPARCDGQDGGDKQACCVHGMPTFPHWHRLFTLQFEQALRRHGSAISAPYWDWTLPFTQLPALFTEETFYDVWHDEVVMNPFVRGFVPGEDTYTTRDIQPEIFLTTADGKHSVIFELVLSALEQTDYCDFEVQFEVMHNAIHYLIGGHQTYALSSLEYSAYDPLFYIHHAFTDKVWAVWQALQERRHLPHNKADCALNYMSSPIRPFHFADFNANSFTREHAYPNKVFDYSSLGYVYDDLTIGGLDLDGLEEAIADQQNHARVFAGFLLKGIKTSGSVVLNLCLHNKACTYAGRFNLLGGPSEMPWNFDRLFKLDITRPLQQAGLHPEDVFDAESLFKLEVKVSDVQGKALEAADVMPQPSIIYQPAAGASQATAPNEVAGFGVRKNVNSLSASEVKSIRNALRKVMEDKGPNGFQNIASFHGLPARCELNGMKIACCQHGMANFPQWHRLFIKQFEDALTSQGSKIGIPYWDWTSAFTALPALVTEEEDNPFHHGVTFDGHQTSRSPREQLFNDPEFGDESFFYRQTLLAFEQTDYCDFEVQYEINHNAIHSWTGGRSPYGMSTLEYTAYDPLFLLHHSNVDRQFAIWQALQKFRGLPYNSANCAIHKLREPMRPFSDENNTNAFTKKYAKAVDAFDYGLLNYQYDNLNFHGLTISELNDLLEKKKEEDRVFVEFMLHGFKAGADVEFKLCDEKGHCQFAGTFAVLGGEIEMPWSFDRLFKYDVTHVFRKMNLRVDDQYHFEVDIVRVDGTKLDSDLINKPSVEFVPGVRSSFEKVAAKTVKKSENLVRKDIKELTLAETKNLKDALYKMQNDLGPNGFEAIAGFHGAPFKCPARDDDKYACCAHGMPVFPHWHRLHTLQFEQALRDHGALIGIPYWDFTTDIDQVPTFFTDSTDLNPFAKYHISFVDADTQRNISEDIKWQNMDRFGDQNKLFHLALLALEEDNYCNFEVQYEFLHNEMHALIGGSAEYSMFGLDYSAFDPFFMILHSSIDRIWLIWQELQKLRHKPFNHAECGGRIMNEPLIPFSYPEVNKNDFTRQHSNPGQLFDISKLGYEYDRLVLNGRDLTGIIELIAEQMARDRTFLGIVASGQRNTGRIGFLRHDKEEDGADRFHELGSISLLGGKREMPWAFERYYKYDISSDPIKLEDGDQMVRFQATSPQGKVLMNYDLIPTLFHRGPHAQYDTVRLDLSNKLLPPKIILKAGTRLRFLATADADKDITAVERMGSLTNLNRCKVPPFAFRASQLGTDIPLEAGDYYFVANDVNRCKKGKRIVVHVDDY